MIGSIFAVFLLPALMFPAALPASEETAVQDDYGKSISWSQGNRIELEISDPERNARQFSKWLIFDSGDVLIEKNDSYEGEESLGTLGIISGKIMITKRLDLDAGYEIDAADDPALMMQHQQLHRGRNRTPNRATDRNQGQRPTCKIAPAPFYFPALLSSAKNSIMLDTV